MNLQKNFFRKYVIHLFIYFLFRIKQEYPGITQKDAFKKAAEQWTASPDNPKNLHH